MNTINEHDNEDRPPPQEGNKSKAQLYADKIMHALSGEYIDENEINALVGNPDLMLTKNFADAVLEALAISLFPEKINNDKIKRNHYRELKHKAIHQLLKRQKEFKSGQGNEKITQIAQQTTAEMREEIFAGSETTVSL